MYQKLVIVGNLGRDPEMRYTPTGAAVTSFPIATSRKYATADGQQKEETTWFRVSVWGKQAENVNQYLKKGQKALVEGKLIADDTGSPRIWTGKDGTVHASFEVRADTVRFLSSKSSGQGSEPKPSGPSAGGADTEPQGGLRF